MARRPDPAALLHDDARDQESTPLPSAVLAAHAADALEAPRSVDRDIWSLTWPVILSQSLASAVSLIDIAMLGRLGTETLAAVGYATQFFHLAQAALMAVGIACVALMARAIGAGQIARARRVFAASLMLSVCAAALVTTATLLSPAPLFRLLNAPESVVRLALPYLQLTLGSSLLLAISLTYENAFRAAKNTRTPLWIASWVTAAKLALNVVLIFGWFGLPRLDLVGAGLATLGSQCLAIVLFVGTAARRTPTSPLRLRAVDFARARPLLGETLLVATPAVAERVLMNLAIMSYFAVMGSYGAVEVAAYTVGVRILAFSWIPGTGFSAAASTLVGQALGAREPDRAERAGWRAVRFAFAVSVVLGIGFVVAREPLARVFTSDPAVVGALGPFMLIMALAQPFMGVHFTLGGALRGAGDTLTPLYGAVLGNWGLRVPFAALFAFGLRVDIVFVWLALSFDHVARAVWMWRAFSRGKWRSNLGARARRAA